MQDKKKTKEKKENRSKRVVVALKALFIINIKKRSHFYIK